MKGGDQMENKKIELIEREESPVRGPEIFVFRNDKTGESIELQSTRLSIEKLSKLGTDSYRELVKTQTKKIPTGVE